jgi:hypothetical protein
MQFSFRRRRQHHINRRFNQSPLPGFNQQRIIVAIVKKAEDVNRILVVFFSPNTKATKQQQRCLNFNISQYPTQQPVTNYFWGINATFID